MKKRRVLGTWVVTAATLCCSSVWVPSASADFTLNARYTGVVTNVTDAYGVFGPVAPGDSVDGIVRYASPNRPPDFGDDTLASYNFPVTNRGSNELTVNLGGLHLAATGNFIVSVYNVPDPDSPADSIFGYDFFSHDGDTALLATAGLPNGDSFSLLNAVVGLYSTDPSLPFDPPNPPSTLLPIDRYDSAFTGGVLVAQISDADGRLVDEARISFQLTSATAVPEPSSALLVGMALPLIAARARRKRSRRMV
jgi:hypothetical protein